MARSAGAFTLLSAILAGAFGAPLPTQSTLPENQSVRKHYCLCDNIANGGSATAMTQPKRGRGRPAKGASGAMSTSLASVRVDDEHLEAYSMAAQIAGNADRADWIRQTLDREAARVLRRHVKENGLPADSRAAELLHAATKRIKTG